MDFVKPQKARKFKDNLEFEKVILSKDWVSERKFRGHRLLTKSGLCWSSIGHEKSIDWLGSIVPPGALLDGEVVTSNPLCREGDVTTAIASNQLDLRYVVFDILFCDGKSVMNQIWERRRDLVIETVSRINHEWVDASELAEKNHVEFYERVISEGGEGLMFKRKGTVYKPGSRCNWIKHKPEFDVDVVIVDAEGYPTPGSGSDVKGYRNIRYGLYDQNGKLRILGSLGRCGPKEKLEEKYVGKVAAVTCVGQFESGFLNHIISVNVRDDKLPEQCVFKFND